MAIQTVKTGAAVNDGTGDDARTAFTKINQNFTNSANAASRLVGTATGNVMEVGAFGVGSTNITTSSSNTTATNIDELLQKPNGFYTVASGANWGTTNAPHSVFGTAIVASRNIAHSTSLLILPYGAGANPNAFSLVSKYTTNPPIEQIVYTSKNPIIANTVNAATSGKLVSVLATGELQSIGFSVDGNGFIKKASPIVKLFADKIELNAEAELQPIAFEKLGVGEYLVRGSTGFAQEGWYIEMPKDANGNVLVAVIYEQLANNDVSVKTYDYMLNKKGRIVPDPETPLDIPEARWIDIRLQELPQTDVNPADETVATNAE